MSLICDAQNNWVRKCIQMTVGMPRSLLTQGPREKDRLMVTIKNYKKKIKYL